MPAPPETRALGRGTDSRFPRYRLVVVEGPDAGAACQASSQEVSIGTAEANDLVLTDGTVSRHHVALEPSPHGPLLRDLGSTNGTVVNGVRVERAYLPARATIAIGHTVVRYEPEPDSTVEALSAEDRWGRALGGSDAMRRIFALLPRVAAAEATVLLEGETGTGKSLIAEAIHEASPRASGPLVVLDCGAIPPTLIESELFGHERGAFTGATQQRVGVFEAATGGTVFLDEIGELPLELQPKLLRALEDRTVRRVGGVDAIKLDVRLLAATNRDLRQEVNKGRFRPDLFYRLNTVRLRIPSLRERRDDIPLLVAHFYAQYAGPGEAPPAELIADFVRRDWPGNVRELRSAVERAVLLTDPDVWRELQGADAPAPAQAVVVDEAVSFRAAKERAVAEWERGYVAALIERHDGNLSRAARAVRMDRNHLRELLRRHGVGVRDE